MHSLFLRIFVSLWLMMTAIGAASAVIYAIAGGHELGRRRAFLEEAVRTHGQLTLALLEAGQEAEAEARLATLREGRGVSLYILDPNGDPVVGSPPPHLVQHAGTLHARSQARIVEAGEDELVAVREGDHVVVASAPKVPRWRRFLRMSTLPFRVLAVFLVSGLTSYLLARYLTRPLGRLSAATRRFADGDLTVRVSNDLPGAPVEIRALGRDFDAMAERIEQLLATQERLLRDVSHELRSPLARLSVALGIARKRSDDSIAGPLDRIELESERLSELIGQILTVTRLEEARRVSAEPIDVVALLEDVVLDTNYELQGEDRVRLVTATKGEISGDIVALRQAFENVVRNAARLTEGPVEVTLDRTAVGSLRVGVRDHGPGVPESDLGRIFEPFYRVDDSRNRGTGGTGIGLAITELAVRLHGGSVRAENALDGGLQITIDLPLSGSSALNPAESRPVAWDRSRRTQARGRR